MFGGVCFLLNGNLLIGVWKDSLIARVGKDAYEAALQEEHVKEGIKTAEFEIRTANIVGSRIRVTNLDGSTHVEEIAVWRPGEQLQLQMKYFSPPLSRLATDFVETWEFQRIGGVTKVLRSFEMHAKSIVARPVLWLISFLLQRAITRHLRQMRRRC